MDNFLTFLKTHSGGLLVLFLCLAAIVFLVQWLAWIFSLGRFRPDRTGGKVGTSSLRFVFADLLVKIINDFRHFLALVMVTIFALALSYVLYRAEDNMASITDAMQTVVATLGGLVGSILGYYFGESAARKSLEEAVGERPVEEPAQADSQPRGDEKPPRPAPAPPTPAEPTTRLDN
ncbi:MAG: hypothetical protein ONB44_18570 [candidate division KSB1 bacterium]|nr:hypothetical protein [candidate division KSB1 bacterium]MDZ7304135.1 hypothetical protein [candidate division KSB1 bacterium]MDZ7314091.1 hypothetical protein [candidate division KSB1 bacterium]